MSPETLYKEFVAGFEARKFSAGLLVAFIDFFVDIGIPESGARNFDDVLARFPRQTTTAGGKRANTLIVRLTDGRTRSLRPYYNQA